MDVKIPEDMEKEIRRIIESLGLDMDLSEFVREAVEWRIRQLS